MWLIGHAKRSMLTIFGLSSWYANTHMVALCNV